MDDYGYDSGIIEQLLLQAKFKEERNLIRPDPKKYSLAKVEICVKIGDFFKNMPIMENFVGE